MNFSSTRKSFPRKGHIGFFMEDRNLSMEVNVFLSCWISSSLPIRHRRPIKSATPLPPTQAATTIGISHINTYMGINRSVLIPLHIPSLIETSIIKSYYYERRRMRRFILFDIRGCKYDVNHIQQIQAKRTIKNVRKKRLDPQLNRMKIKHHSSL